MSPSFFDIRNGGDIKRCGKTKCKERLFVDSGYYVDRCADEHTFNGPGPNIKLKMHPLMYPESAVEAPDVKMPYTAYQESAEEAPDAKILSCTLSLLKKRRT